MAQPEAFTTELINLPHIATAWYMLRGTVFGQSLRGRVEQSNAREYGRAQLEVLAEDPLMVGLSKSNTVWMSHSDTIVALPRRRCAAGQYRRSKMQLIG